MAINRECTLCGKEYQIEMFPQTTSSFFKGGRSNVCIHCIESKIDGEDYGSVDKACQWLDYPLLMGEWMKIYKIHRKKAFRYYAELFFKEGYVGIVHWKEGNDILKEIVDRGDYSEVCEEFDMD